MKNAFIFFKLSKKRSYIVSYCLLYEEIYFEKVYKVSSSLMSIIKISFKPGNIYENINIKGLS
jgi:hypothetical protein